jgi:hypothetical protein
MSKINIQGTIDNIKTRTNIYSPLIEAIVNSIEAIDEIKKSQGKINVILLRENTLDSETTVPNVQNVQIQDNGIGFNQKHRDSFDTFYSAEKKNIGGKGFGRFMYLKYFNDVQIDSTYKDGKEYFNRKFSFGKAYDIIINEKTVKIDSQKQETNVYLKNIRNKYSIDKGIETIARKLLEKLLIFFINEVEISIISDTDFTKHSDSSSLSNHLKQFNQKCPNKKPKI